MHCNYATMQLCGYIDALSLSGSNQDLGNLAVGDRLRTNRVEHQKNCTPPAEQTNTAQNPVPFKCKEHVLRMHTQGLHHRCSLQQADMNNLYSLQSAVYSFPGSPLSPASCQLACLLSTIYCLLSTVYSIVYSDVHCLMFPLSYLLSLLHFVFSALDSRRTTPCSMLSPLRPY